MLIKVCDVCMGEHNKITKATGRFSKSYYDGHVRVGVDVCVEHKEFFKVLGPDEATSKIQKLYEKTGKKKIKLEETT